jgi:hypothetical protein
VVILHQGGQEPFGPSGFGEAIDSTGATIGFLLSALRDAAAAKRLFRQALSDPSHLQPRVINTDKARLYGSTIAAVKEEGTLLRRWAGVRYVKPSASAISKPSIVVTNTRRERNLPPPLPKRVSSISLIFRQLSSKLTGRSTLSGGKSQAPIESPGIQEQQ